MGLILLVVFAIITTAVGNSKGYSGVGCFFAGLLLGPVALIIIFITQFQFIIVAISFGFTKAIKMPIINRYNLKIVLPTQAHRDRHSISAKSKEVAFFMICPSFLYYKTSITNFFFFARLKCCFSLSLLQLLFSFASWRTILIKRVEERLWQKDKADRRSKA